MVNLSEKRIRRKGLHSKISPENTFFTFPTLLFVGVLTNEDEMVGQETNHQRDIW
jgi:hypothetical protein